MSDSDVRSEAMRMTLGLKTVFHFRIVREFYFGGAFFGMEKRKQATVGAAAAFGERSAARRRCHTVGLGAGGVLNETSVC